MNNIKQLIENQREFYNTRVTQDINYRIKSLEKLEYVIKKYIPEIESALNYDLKKTSYESYLMEIGFVLDELSKAQKNIYKWCKKKWVVPSKLQFPSLCYKSPNPYGNVLIMSPWNYPFMLTLDPLIGAIAAGNCVIIKPSDYSTASSKLIKKIIGESFERGHVDVVLGGREENVEILDQHFQYIFFTGSTEVGKLVLEKAARYLTPVTLELGGKSPCIVDETSDLKIAAKRIVFGKFANAGQTCIAPDYVLVQEKVYHAFLDNLKKYIIEDIGIDPLHTEDYGKIISTKHYSRLMSLIKDQNIFWGGGSDDLNLCIEPTIIINTKKSDKIMQEEIFGPILPVISYGELEEAIEYINTIPNPLALYYFTKSNQRFKKVDKYCNFGGGCCNDTILHMATGHLPFGGVGNSGMGSYHGKYTFDTFSHYTSILKSCTLFENPLRYRPYTKTKERVIKTIL
ncbi:TPA: aldehyde dehydrogenase [Clostridioides difficile]|uniref:aldehyde dehydrogenase n=1 Tax=Clostridioides difficile TaxID=1496 RepID=UPI00038D0971|nr:aldehyde dehydrogenase [Clostridioides difficile]EGT4625362.1 aldehyde dehydrogenase [Clostridioides difficile]ELX4576153.1 aldehyde dehydrogenase [Clostridioides difficile]EQK76132.1 aldehyde dehydrogenase family protein [Clostridioides difficile CD113]MBH6986783.1 aldehyde dehydrogenase [Clostridioides difficile]MBH7139330.1 aldehyde dehydrogenase [Clostridioides difficile]